MTDVDERLKALFAGDLPPPHDPVFQARLLEVMVRRAFLVDLVLLLAFSLAAAAALWVFWPTVAGLAGLIGPAVQPALVALAAVAGILLMTSMRFGPRPE